MFFQEHIYYIIADNSLDTVKYLTILLHIAKQNLKVYILVYM